MRDIVKNTWIAFNKNLEGIVYCMYADVLGLVSTGMGNLIDPIAAALGLPWALPNGSPASRAQIIAAWNAVKNDPLCKIKGWVYASRLAANNIRLSRGAVEKLIFSKLDAHDRVFQKKFSGWEDRPADAQLAVHSMAWAMGSDFTRKFPKFTRLFEAGDYAAAAEECKIDEKDGGTIVERNKRNRSLLLKAAYSDPDTVSWP